MLKSISVSKDHHQYLKKAKILKYKDRAKRLQQLLQKLWCIKKTSLRRKGKYKQTRSTVHQKRAVVKAEQ